MRPTGRRSSAGFLRARPDVPYRYLPDIATADVAFEATGASVEEMFAAAADATMNVMVEDLSTIVPGERRAIDVSSESLDMLLFEFLQELIFYKDAEQLLLRAPRVSVESDGGTYRLSAEAEGERIDTARHPFNVDVKAVTLHRFRVEETPDGWRATVILDI